MNSPYPMLWFDHQALEAAELYISLLPDSRIEQVSRYPDGGRSPAGEVMTVAFELGGTRYMALNGGPNHVLSPAMSLVVECEDQAEIDRLWEALTAGGGEPGPCGWLVDPFGLSWQIIPRGIGELLATPEAMEAMYAMSKLDIAALRAAAGRS